MTRALAILVCFGIALLAAATAGPAAPDADAAKTATSLYASQDVPLDTDATADFWRQAPPIHADRDNYGTLVPGHGTTILSRWTEKNLYFLFVCPYQDLYLKENPDTVAETNKLWNWDVAEVFIGSNFADIQRYKEFEMSPQGEWLDLDINLANRNDSDWTWNSGFEVSARIDRAKKIWYGAMRIPFAAIAPSAASGLAVASSSSAAQTAPRSGMRFRVNFYRSQGPPAAQKRIAWQATERDTFHVPAAFGILELVGR
ncbi:MAG: carbohydrate-binding family 9-like protein [Candidatus Acidiferrales bacterium]